MDWREYIYVVWSYGHVLSITFGDYFIELGGDKVSLNLFALLNSLTLIEFKFHQIINLVKWTLTQLDSIITVF